MRLFIVSIFITFYRFSLFLNRIKHHVAFNDDKLGAVLYLSSFEAFNLLVLFWFFNLQQSIGLPIMVLPYMLVFYLINWFYFIRKGNGKKFVDEYYKYSLNQRRVSKMISIVYVIVTFTAPIIYNEFFK